MVKETEAEEAMGFVVIFLSLVSFQFVGPGPSGTFLATPMQSWWMLTYHLYAK